MGAKPRSSNLKKSRTSGITALPFERVPGKIYRHQFVTKQMYLKFHEIQWQYFFELL